MAEYLRKTIRAVTIDTPRGPVDLRDVEIAGGFVATTAAVVVNWNSAGRREFRHHLPRLGLRVSSEPQSWEGKDKQGHPVCSLAVNITGPAAAIEELIRLDSVLRCCIIDGPAQTAGAKGQYHRLHKA